MLPALLAACSTPDGFPSLDRRPGEIALTAQPAPADPAPVATPIPLDAGLTTRIAALVKMARDADDRFSARLEDSRRTIAAAGRPASDSWSAAQVALSELQGTRARTMTALADLDELYFEARGDAPVELSSQAQTVASAREEVSALIVRQDRILAELSGRLGT